MNRWYGKSVVYQIYPMSFKDSNNDGIGDINGITSKLEYLKDLGVDIIWLSPIYESPMDDNGYDISDYYNINPLFGTLEDFTNMLNKAHELNIKIIMDLVVNHTSDEHVWFKEALKDKFSKYRDYYIFRNNENNTLPNDITSIFSGSAWELTEDKTEYYFHLFSKKQPDLNWENEELRKEIYKMINYWLDLGVDGFRMDVIDLIGKDIDNRILGNGPMLHTYLKEMYNNCFKGRKTVTVGETGGVTPDIAIEYTKPSANELDMVFQFEHIGLDQIPNKDKWHLKELDLIDLKKCLSRWQTQLHDKGWNSLYWSNHDQPRIVSRWGNDKEYREKSAKMLGAVLHFMEGTPYIYQGEEIGMTNYPFTDISEIKDIETINMYNERINEWGKEKLLESINVKGRDNARTPIQWNDKENAGFTEGIPWIKVNPNYKEINVKNALENKNSIYYFYQKLIKLRKDIDCIVYGDYELLLPDDKHIFAYKRTYQNEEIILIANFSEESINYKYDIEDYENIIGNYEPKNNYLNPYEVQVYYKINN